MSKLRNFLFISSPHDFSVWLSRLGCRARRPLSYHKSSGSWGSSGIFCSTNCSHRLVKPNQLADLSADFTYFAPFAYQPYQGIKGHKIEEKNYTYNCTSWFCVCLSTRWTGVSSSYVRNRQVYLGFTLMEHGKHDNCAIRCDGLTPKNVQTNHCQ